MVLAQRICARLLDHDLLSGLIVAAIAFTALFCIWVAGLMGGGDVKLWAATVLLVPPGWQPQFAFFVNVVLAGGLLALLYLGLSLVVPRPRCHTSREPSCAVFCAWSNGVSAAAVRCPMPAPSPPGQLLPFYLTFTQT